MKIKGAPKKVKPTSNDKYTKRSPPFFSMSTHFIFHNSNRVLVRVLIIENPCTYNRKPLLPSHLSKLEHFKEMLAFMNKYIDKIVDVNGDGNWIFYIVSTLIGMGKHNRKLVCQYLTK